MLIFHSCFATSSLLIFQSLARFFSQTVFQVLVAVTAESFPTKLRAKGYGFCNGIGQIGSVIMPYVLITLDHWKQQSVYWCFSILALSACFIIWGALEETLGKKLDIPRKESNTYSISTRSDKYTPRKESNTYSISTRSDRYTP